MNDFPNAEYFRAQAEQMRQFAEETDDPELAGMFKKLAFNFEAKAWSVVVEGHSTDLDPKIPQIPTESSSERLEC